MKLRRGDVATASAGGARIAVRLLVLHACVTDLARSGRREAFGGGDPAWMRTRR